MPVSARLRHQNTTSLSSDGSRHHPMNATAPFGSQLSSLGFQESRRRRQIKSSTRLSKSLANKSHTSSPFSGNSMNTNRLQMHGSPARQRAVSYTSSDDANSSSILTKTGRPSKALKGKPVHKCDVCEKVYTRNEHLRRHQLTHTAESLPCNVAGCGRSFRRAELLVRHKEEHEDGFVRRKSPREDDDTTSARVSKRKLTQSPTAEHNNELAANPIVDSPAPGMLPNRVDGNARAGISESCYYSSSRPTSQFWDPHSGQSSPGVFGTARQDLFNINPTYTPFDSQPTHTFALPPPHTGDEWSRRLEPNGSRSPVSNASSLHRAWPTSHDAQFRSSFSPTDSNQSTSNSTPGIEATTGNMSSNVPYFEDQDAREEAVILNDVTNLAHSFPGLDDQARLEQLEGHYLEAFWTRFNSVFSVMHRHTFITYGTSPLVRALMIAIGAQYFDDDAAQTMSRTLREACAKLIQRRPHLDYNFSRLWDLQALFLQEAFSIYCSRRPCSRFSQGFEDLLTGLLSDRDNLFYASPLHTLGELQRGIHGPDSIEQRIQWVHLESKRRLLLACYVLEVQQNNFFGSHRPISDKNLPLPCSAALWEANSVEDWQALTYEESTNSRSLSDALAVAYPGILGNDSFMFNIVLAHNAHCGAAAPSYHSHTYPQAPVQTRQAMFSSAATQLAINTPVHDLLAVSGETFVLGQKLATQEQFDHAVCDLRSWATNGSSATAVHHAKALYKLAFEHGRIGLLHEDWALTLAALVFWATAMFPQRSEMAGLARSIPVHGAQQLARNAVNVHTMDYVGARACLAYARDRMQGRLGWLTQDASGMLGKLVEGRIIDPLEHE